MIFLSIIIDRLFFHFVLNFVTNLELFHPRYCNKSIRNANCFHYSAFFTSVFHVLELGRLYIHDISLAQSQKNTGDKTSQILLKLHKLALKLTSRRLIATNFPVLFGNTLFIMSHSASQKKSSSPSSSDP